MVLMVLIDSAETALPPPWGSYTTST